MAYCLWCFYTFNTQKLGAKMDTYKYRPHWRIQTNKNEKKIILLLYVADIKANKSIWTGLDYGLEVDEEE